jgi:hypothetical protein
VSPLQKELAELKTKMASDNTEQKTAFRDLAVDIKGQLTEHARVENDRYERLADRLSVRLDTKLDEVIKRIDERFDTLSQRGRFA